MERSGGDEVGRGRRGGGRGERERGGGWVRIEGWGYCVVSSCGAESWGESDEFSAGHLAEGDSRLSQLEFPFPLFPNDSPLPPSYVRSLIHIQPLASDPKHIHFQHPNHGSAGTTSPPCSQLPFLYPPSPPHSPTFSLKVQPPNPYLESETSTAIQIHISHNPPFTCITSPFQRLGHWDWLGWDRDG